MESTWNNQFTGIALYLVTKGNRTHGGTDETFIQPLAKYETKKLEYSRP